jgi:SPRY domain
MAFFNPFAVVAPGSVKLPNKFDPTPKHLSPRVTITHPLGDGSTATCSKSVDDWRGAITELATNDITFRIRSNPVNKMKLGLINRATTWRKDSDCSAGKESYTINSDGTLCGFTSGKYTTPLVVDNYVRIVRNVAAHTISFSINGVDKGVAFSGVPDGIFLRPFPCTQVFPMFPLNACVLQLIFC